MAFYLLSTFNKGRVFYLLPTDRKSEQVSFFTEHKISCAVYMFREVIVVTCVASGQAVFYFLFFYFVTQPATFWRTFHHDGKISLDWWGVGVHAHPHFHFIYHPVQSCVHVRSS
jgi:hypothetical protein